MLASVAFGSVQLRVAPVPLFKRLCPLHPPLFGRAPVLHEHPFLLKGTTRWIYLNVIIHGDSASILKAIPDGSLDLALTDPPYGVRYKDRTGMSISELCSIRTCLAGVQSATASTRGHLLLQHDLFDTTLKDLGLRPQRAAKRLPPGFGRFAPCSRVPAKALFRLHPHSRRRAEVQLLNLFLDGV